MKTTLTTTKTLAKSTPAPVPATPTLDALLPLVVALYGPEFRWMLEGWANHLRPTKHPLHTRNSWKKHAGEFGDAFDGAKLLVLARLVDFGLSAEDAGKVLHGESDATPTAH